MIIVNSDIQYFTSQQLEIINQLGSKKKDISDLSGIKEMLTSKVSTTPTNSNISIVPRKNKKDNKASYIFHLLNRNYDYSTDSSKDIVPVELCSVSPGMASERAWNSISS